MSQSPLSSKPPASPKKTTIFACPEVQSGIFVILLGFLAFGILEDQPLDPWQLIHPRQLATILFALSSLELVSHLTQQKLKGSKIEWLSGFLGGLISSTATVYYAAKRAKTHPRQWGLQVTTAVLATLASLLELLFIMEISSPDLRRAFWPSLIAASGVGGGLSYWVSRNSPTISSTPKIGPPINIRRIFKLTLTFGGIFALVAFSQKQLGENAAYLITFLSGLFELHGLASATGSLLDQQKLTLNEAKNGIELAVFASFLSKTALIWTIDRGIFARRTTAILWAMFATFLVISQLT